LNDWPDQREIFKSKAASAAFSFDPFCVFVKRVEIWFKGIDPNTGMQFSYIFLTLFDDLSAFLAREFQN
jgi:hypothetical protein